MPFVIDQNQKQEPAWRTYDGDVEILINPLTRQDFRKLQKKALVKKRGFRNQDPEVNEEYLDQSMYRQLVQDWKGIVDPAGTAIECTPEMVDLVMGQMNDLADWIADTALSLAEEIAAKKGKQLGN